MIDVVLKPAVSFIAEMIESVLRTEIENASYSKASLLFYPKPSNFFFAVPKENRTNEVASCSSASFPVC